MTLEQETHSSEVYAWRLERLQEMGFDREGAEVLASSKADLHQIDRMLKQGCSHELAFLIVL